MSVAPRNRETFSDRVVRRVAELPDRSSPEDWPEAMLVTADELARIVNEELDSILVAEAR